MKKRIKIVAPILCGLLIAMGLLTLVFSLNTGENAEDCINRWNGEYPETEKLNIYIKWE